MQQDKNNEPQINFKPISSNELADILDLTIKHDRENKITTFLCCLSAYTENSQFNISLQAPSSSGKSYIPLQISMLFPIEDVIVIAYCSPTAFFHDTATYNKEKNLMVVDMSGKIILFLDQPHTILLQHLRPILSHDKKEILLKITDKSQKGGLKTKNVLLRGFPAVIFCTAGLKIDEQEATRFLLLSPEINREKIEMGIYQEIFKGSDIKKYQNELDENSERKLLKERIQAIKNSGIRDVKLDKEKIVSKFFLPNKKLKPRHQRDIKRIISLIKCFALLNFWWRDGEGDTITANEIDYEEAFQIWDKISRSQELNLPPYIYDLYKEVILSAYNEKNSGNRIQKIGITRQEILKKYYNVYDRMLDVTQLRQQILPMLETAGLIYEETDPIDKRQKIIFPVI